mgnify:CR=1 FL=1
MRAIALNQRLVRGQAPSYERLQARFAEGQGTQPSQARTLHCGWGRLLIGHTFANNESLAGELLNQRGKVQTSGDAGLSVIVHAGSAGFKSQFKRADASGARVAVILGADEVASQTASVKFLRAEGQGDSAQQQVPLAKLADALNNKG